MIANEDRNEVSGLCMTCNHAKFCIYLASAISSIWSCEEFDDRPPVIDAKKIIKPTRLKLTRETKRVGKAYEERRVRKAS